MGDNDRPTVSDNTLDSTAATPSSNRERLRRAGILARKTIVVDLDGVLVQHAGDEQHGSSFTWLPGAQQWCKNQLDEGHCLVIMTGRGVQHKVFVETKLVYDIGLCKHWILVMGVASGQRILINDNKPYSDQPMAVAHCIERNGDVTKTYPS